MVALDDPGEVKVDFQFGQRTVRPIRRQMGEESGTKPEKELMDLCNVFASRGPEADRTAKDSLAVRIEGRRRIRHNPNDHNLEVIVSIGRKVSSRRGARFQQFATRTMHHKFAHGHTMNESRLAVRDMVLKVVCLLLGRHPCRSSSDFGVFQVSRLISAGCRDPRSQMGCIGWRFRLVEPQASDVYPCIDLKARRPVRKVSACRLPRTWPQSRNALVARSTRSSASRRVKRRARS